MSEHTEPQVDQIEALFVQSAHGLTSSGGTLTFHGLAHSTLFFSVGAIVATLDLWYTLQQSTDQWSSSREGGRHKRNQKQPRQ